jgi:hypothetical protein
MMSRRLRVIVAAVFVVLLALGRIIPTGPILGQIFGVSAPTVHDAATLPDQISVCGRVWTRDALNRQFSRAQIRAQFGVEASVVDPGLVAPCPAGPCTLVGENGPCDTVVFVRVGEDAYLDYALQGGP